MGIPINSIKPSMTLVYDDNLFEVLTCEHSKVARGSAFCRVKLRNLKNAQTLECTLRDSDNVEQAYIEKRDLQYLYNKDGHYHFLDLETYEDLILDENKIKDKISCFKDNQEISGIFYENELIDLELPISIVLKVSETEPGYRGDTVKGGSKQAKLETGLVISVPLFINIDDMVKIDTRTKEYLGRA